MTGKRVALAGVVTASHQSWVRRRRWRWLPWPKVTVPVIVIEAVRVDRIDVATDIEQALMGADPAKYSP